ncbi:hypothetical protein C8J56DRAFT_962576 [Mycena floridula]|nr:hypothetical protein C8J56DRAFT_962576 [Mycena floridula]
MTSRLKRRLGDLGIDASSAKANESFCQIGTPLPPLEKSRDTGEFVPLWKQDVRDEKGRRRLHGAFTGGFSAGYFNTVGSKEGWAPTAFVSSRGDRAKKKAARPEDFMDEEDLQELKDSRSLVETTDEMDLTGGRQPDNDEEDPDSIVSALEASMLPAPKDSAGARILKKMGWRIGQGIGPRVTLRQRKLQDLQASTGHTRPLDAITIPDEDEEANKHTYAPRDTAVLVVERKSNYHGIGYSPGMGLNESLGVRGGKGPSGPNLASGFGLGALNDADEDDLDVYDSSFGNKGHIKTAYDIGTEEDDRITMGSGSRKQGEMNSRPTPTDLFHDGTPVLAGFVLSENPVVEDRWFPLPDIPKDWTPNPHRIWNNSPGKENIDAKQPVSHEKWKSTISADQRGSLLGETPLPAAPRSVFEFMSQKDRERIKNIAANPSTGPAAPPPPASITIARIEPHVASAALRGFQPFTSEPAKQARYLAYLHSQADPTSAPDVELKPLPSQSIEEFNKELQDYSKSALIFKPISGAMAGRFTSAAIVEHGSKVHEGLHTPSANDEPAAVEEKKVEEEISPRAHAAKMGMFGPLTREIQPWIPDRLLCKRFGVKDPNPKPATTDEMPPAAAAAPEMNVSQVHVPVDEPKSSKGPRDLNNVGLGEDETQGRETLTYQRPAMDVFKAIFASDDEDSDSEDAKMDDPEPEPEPAPAVEPAVEPEPIPAAPVNALVDLSTFKPTFIPRDGKSKPEKEKSKEKKKKQKKSLLVSFEMDEEGAGESETVELPKKKKKRKAKPVVDNDDDAMWVEKPMPAAVQNLQSSVSPAPPGEQASLAKGRKRAVDFM